MRNETYKTVTLVTADRGKYLRIANLENSEEVFGKPERIVFNNQGIIPELEEADLNIEG